MVPYKPIKIVIFMMGWLHVCFNCMRDNGQHNECSGLEDTWLEADVFAVNTIHTLMDGKRHILTYEALSILKWCYFERWLLDKTIDIPALQDELADIQFTFSLNTRNREHVKTACASIAARLKKTNIIVSLDQFEQDMITIRNFAFWNTYLRLIKILMCFVKAQRTGDWPMHI